VQYGPAGDVIAAGDDDVRIHPRSLPPSFLPSLVRSLFCCKHVHMQIQTMQTTFIHTYRHRSREKELYEASRWREDGDVDDVPVKPQATSKIAEDLNIKKEGEPESKKKSLIRSLSSKEGVA
jgi:hypothetical protein